MRTHCGRHAKQRSNSDLQRRGFAARRLVRGWLVASKDVKSWRRRWFEFFRRHCVTLSPEALAGGGAGAHSDAACDSVRVEHMGKQNLIEVL